MSSSLSSVVSNLVRASVGSSVPNTVSDEDLDRHVAELILKEAKKKAERYGQQGIRAYISSNLSDSNAPRPNKRFLSSIIRSTDDHNKTVLRAQAEAAQEIKREREESERRERKRRAEEAAEAERLRRSQRHSKRKRASTKEDGWDRWDGRTSSRNHKPRDWATWDGYDDESEQDDERYRRRKRRRHSSSRDRDSLSRGDDEVLSKERKRYRSRSRSPKRKYSVERDRPNDKNPERSKDRQRHSRDKHRSDRKHSRHSPSPSRRDRSPSSTCTADSSPRKRRSRSPKYALDDLRDEDSLKSRHISRRRLHTSDSHDNINEREAELRQKLMSAHKQSESLNPTAGPSKRHRSRSVASKRSPSPPAQNNLLETASSSSRTARTRSMSRSRSSSRSPTPGPEPPIQLPSKMDKYFEQSYDPRLDVAPLSAPKIPATGLIDNTEFEGWDAMLDLIRIRQADKEEKKRMERLGLTPKEKSKSKKKSTTTFSAAGTAERWGGDDVNIMDIKYKKRGSVREWDLGKEGF